MLSKLSKSLKLILSAMLILLVVGLIYSNSYQCTWHFDDLSYIVNNPTIRKLTNIREMWNHLTAPGRTVVLYSFALNYHFGKTDVFGYHLTNNAIHMLNALLVWWMVLLIFQTPRLVGRRMGQDKVVLALFIALVFATHPMQTQAVTYICQRFASLATLFYIAAFNCYLRARLKPDKKGVFFGLAMIAAILGMFSKQIVITLPVTILVAEWLLVANNNSIKGIYKGINWKYVLPAMAFMLIIPSLYGFDISRILSITHKSSGSFRGEQLDSYTYFLTQMRVIPTYLRLMVFPIGQNLLYDFSSTKTILDYRTLMGMTFIMGCLLGGIYYKKKNVLLTFGVLWFFITLIVESSFITIRHVIFEHRVYLPSIGFSFVVVSVIYALVRDKKRLITILCIFVCTLSVLTYQRNKIWLDEFTLWNDVKSKSPHKMRPYLNVGLAYSARGKYDEAIYEFNKALEKHPDNILVLNNKGIVYTKLLQFDFALSEFNRAIKKDAKWAEVWNNRGDVYRHKKEYQLALDDYNKALSLKPQLYRTLSNRGVVYSHLGRNDLALADLNRAIEIDSDFSEAYQNRGNLYGMTKNYEKAVADFTKVLEGNPNVPQVYNNRANAFRRLKKYKLALEDYNTAIQLDPKFAEGYNNRGVIYRNWKKYQLAIDDYNTAISINPDYVTAYNNRGNLYKITGKLDLAIRDFNTAIGIDPSKAVIYYNRAKTFLGQGDYDKAFIDAKKAKELGFSNAVPLIQRLSQMTHEK